MSVVALYRDDSCVILGADGVSSNLDGTIRATVAKVYTLPHLNCLVAHTGAGGLGTKFLDVLNAGFVDKMVSSFDDVADVFLQVAEEGYRRLVEETWEEFGPELPDSALNSTVILAGWSERSSRCEAYKTSSYEKAAVSISGENEPTEPWTLQPIEGFYASQWPSEDIQAEFGPDGSHPALDFIARTVSACRAQPSRAEGNEIRTAVGGSLLMYYLDRSKVVSWVAHRWPDQLGEHVDPSAGQPMPEFPLLMP